MENMSHVSIGLPVVLFLEKNKMLHLIAVVNSEVVLKGRSLVMKEKRKEEKPDALILVRYILFYRTLCPRV